MKKNFFKKLSFVLALAMIVSVIAPAAGAFAATAPTLNFTKTKYLHLGRDDANEFNFNINNKGKGWSYAWTSADEDVVTVNPKNGVVTATGAGTTTVSVYIEDKDGEEVDTLTAKVTVRDNIETVTISNEPTEAIAVGDEYDFNRSYTTEAGLTKGSESVTRWTVDSENATISDKGVFVATEAGEYTITARSFQSKSKYNSWNGDNEKYADYVLATDEAKITVAAGMTEANQVDLKSVDVVFSSPLTKEEVAANLYVNYMIGEVAIKEQKIKSVEMSADGLTATVEIYDEFVPEQVYQITYPEMDPVTFVAATTNPEDVVAIDIKTTKTTVLEDTKVEVALLNKDGVKINTEILESRLSFESSNDMTSLVDSSLVILNKGESTTVTATYHYYTYKDNGEENVLKDAQLIIGVENADPVVTSLLAWTIEDDNTPNYDEVNHFIAAKDEGRRLFVQVENSDDVKISSADDYAFDPKFEFNSSDSSVLFVDNTGLLVAVKPGTVRVTVEYDGSFVNYFVVEVSAERKVASLSLDNNAFSLSNGKFLVESVDVSNIQASKDVKAELKDQYGDAYAAINYAEFFEIKPIAGNPSVYTPGFVGDTLTFDAEDLAKGTYRYLVNDVAYPTLQRQLIVYVQEPNSEAVRWALVVTGSDDSYKDGTVDVVVDDTTYEKTLEVQLIGYAKNGVEVTAEDVSGTTDFTITVKDSKGDVLPGAASATEVTYETTWISGSSIQKLETGRYTVEAANAEGVKARAIFIVTDSQKLPVVKVEGFRSDNTNPVLAFADCFKLELDGNAVSAASVDFEGTSVPTRAYVKTATVVEDIDGYDLFLDVDVKFYITVPVDFMY